MISFPLCLFLIAHKNLKNEQRSPKVSQNNCAINRFLSLFLPPQNIFLLPKTSSANKKRSMRITASNEDDQTLNQLLAAMDGFAQRAASRDGIIPQLNLAANLPPGALGGPPKALENFPKGILHETLE